MLALPSLRILRPRMKRGCVTTSTLTGLWITSHVVWSQAYKFKNNDYSQNAKELKRRLKTLSKSKKLALMLLGLYKINVFYANVDLLINPSATVSVNATSASACQYKLTSNVRFGPSTRIASSVSSTTMTTMSCIRA